MSLINKMLQELDRRHALQPPASRSVGNVPAGVQAGSLPDRNLQPVHGATPMVGSEWFWRAVALLILITIGWIAWVAWQVAPRGTVTELALQSANRPRAAPAVAAPAAAASAATTAAAPGTSAPMAAPGSSAPAAAPMASAAVPVAPSTGSAAAAPALQASAAKPDADRPDTLKLALEILTPLKQHSAPPAARPRAGAGAAPKAGAVPAAGAQAHAGVGAMSAIPQAKAGARAPSALSPEPVAKPAMKLATTQALSRAGVPASGQINKRDSGTPRDRAAAEYRRAVNFVNQGRVAEGMEALRAALAFDPSYEAARQTQLTLLLEAKRMDEAATVLREGIALNPANAAFVMLAARIMVERNDVGGALALLQQHAATAAANADYRAFAAALYQRLGRHGEAVSEYGAALRIAPASGAWWVGLGISQEAQQRGAEAADSFRRAKETGTLSTELAGFVDRRLKAQR